METGCGALKRIRMSWEEEESEDPWEKKGSEKATWCIPSKCSSTLSVVFNLMFSSVLYNQSKLGNLPTSPTMMSFPRNKMKSVTLSRTTTLSWVKTSVKHSSNSASQHQLTKPSEYLTSCTLHFEIFFNYWPMFKCIALLCCYQRHVSLFASV